MTTLPAISLPNDGYRRAAGFSLGALAGGAYATVWLAGDRLAVPGVPLYQPPFGLVGDVLMFAAAGGILGLVTAWPRSGLAGTFAASAFSAIAIVAWSYLQAATGAQQDLVATVVTGIFVVLPFWGLLVPVLGGLRWVTARDEEAMRDREKLLRRLSRPLALLLVVAAVSLTALYRQEARVELARTNSMLQSAQAGGTLPAPLASTGFAARGNAAYQLSWEIEGIDKYRIPRPGKNFDQQSVVVARFKNGWNLVCLYITADDPPECQGMEELPN